MKEAINGGSMEIDYNTYTMSRKEKNLYYIGAVCGLIFIGYVFYRNLIFSVLIAGLSIPLKKLYIKYRIEKRREELRNSFKDLLYSLSASVSTGRQMSEAVLEACDSLSMIYSEEHPLIQELLYMKKNITESRSSEEGLLKNFAYRSGIEEIISFADVYSICRETGAKTEAIINKTSEVLTDKLTLMREIKTMASQKLLEAKIISSMPVLIIIFLNVSSPGYLDAMYSTFAGRLAMTAVIGIIVLSYRVMAEILKVRI
ncbi:MAG: type II secretion system F family protein [Anaerovoracaceae bacterium]